LAIIISFRSTPFFFIYSIPMMRSLFIISTAFLVKGVLIADKDTKKMYMAKLFNEIISSCKVEIIHTAVEN